MRVPGETKGDMNPLFREKVKLFADQNGWPLEHAKGFVDGENFRRCGKAPSRLTLVGIDAYCLGFRAGYFERQHAGSTQREVPDRAVASAALR